MFRIRIGFLRIRIQIVVKCLGTFRNIDSKQPERHPVLPVLPVPHIFSKLCHILISVSIFYDLLKKNSWLLVLETNLHAAGSVSASAIFMRIRIQKANLLRIHVGPDPKHWFWIWISQRVWNQIRKYFSLKAGDPGEAVWWKRGIKLRHDWNCKSQKCYKTKDTKYRLYVLT